jgi:hypothetical protein
VGKARGSVAVAGVLWVAQVGGEGGDGDGVGFAWEPLGLCRVAGWSGRRRRTWRLGLVVLRRST